MEIPFVTWGCIVGMFVVILIVQLCRMVFTRVKGKHHVITVGSEREEFFVPGDPDPFRKSDDGDTDIADL